MQDFKFESDFKVHAQRLLRLCMIFWIVSDPLVLNDLLTTLQSLACTM